MLKKIAGWIIIIAFVIVVLGLIAADIGSLFSAIVGVALVITTLIVVAVAICWVME